jgi:hypothetical protein
MNIYYVQSMMNRIYRTEQKGKPIVHIIGKLDSARILTEFLTDIIKDHMQESKNPHSRCTLMFDLAETELITDDCLEILFKYNKTCLLEFKNCSLYVDMLLQEKGLLK